MLRRMWRRPKTRLAFSAEDWRHVEAYRAQLDLPHQEIVGHGADRGSDVAECGAQVVQATPTTAFDDAFLLEQWGPIRLCEVCADRLGVSPELG
jgi:hypothetical protein